MHIFRDHISLEARVASSSIGGAVVDRENEMFHLKSLFRSAISSSATEGCYLNSRCSENQ
jgi:hypothetical protein